MDPRALDSFVVAAEVLNFSEAAARRNTVQSAISTHIRKLEQQLGQRLFDRGRGQGMVLTAEGKAFLAYARRILNLSEEAVAAMQAPKGQRVIRLGTNVTLAMSVVARALKQFAPDNPDVKIEILCDRSDQLLPQLEAGEIDLALMMDQGKRADRIFVEHDQLVWVAGPDFRSQSTVRCLWFFSMMAGICAPMPLPRWTVSDGRGRLCIPARTRWVCGPLWWRIWQRRCCQVGRLLHR